MKLYFSFANYLIPKRMMYSYKDDIAAIRACMAHATHPETIQYFKQRYSVLKKEIRTTASSYAAPHAVHFFHTLLSLNFPPERAFERSLALYKTMRNDFIRASYP